MRTVKILALSLLVINLVLAAQIHPRFTGKAQDSARTKFAEGQEPYKDELKKRQLLLAEHFPGRKNDPEYARSLMAAAAREREINGPQLQVPRTNLTAGQALEIWGSLGPSKMATSKMDAGRLVSIVTHPSDANTLYVASAGGGVWRTTDRGATWTPITETVGSLGCGALAMDPENPNRLYLGLGDPHRFGYFGGELDSKLGTAPGLGILKSTDGGIHWSAAKLLGDSTSIRSIVVSPTDSNLILVATDKGLYRSTNAGASYQLELLDGTKPEVWSIAWAGSNDFTLSTKRDIWHSTTGGNTWAKAANYPVGLGRITLASAPSDPSVQYALATGPGNGPAHLLKSLNGGLNWSSLNAGSKKYTNLDETLDELLGSQGDYNQMVIVLPTNPDIVYFGGQLRLAKTSDGGNSFKLVNSTDETLGTYVHPDFHCAAFDEDNRIYIGNDGGLFRSLDGGMRWQDVNEGLVTHLIFSVASSRANPNVILATLQDNGVMLSKNNSATYEKIGGGDGHACVMSQADPNRIIVSTNGGVYKTDDGGVTGGDMTYPGIPSGTPYFWEQSPSDPDGETLYAISYGKLYVSVNFGNSWHAVPSNGLPANKNVRWVRAGKVAGTLAVLVSGNEIYYTLDFGQHWTKAATPANADGYFLDLAIGPDLQFYVIADGYRDGKARIWTSNDPKNGWVTGGLGGLPEGVRLNIIKADPVKNGVIYIGSDLGLYRSRNKGLTFERWGFGLPLVSVSDLWVASDGSSYRVGTYGRGIWNLVIFGGGN